MLQDINKSPQLSKCKILWVFRRQRQERLSLYKQGEGPDEMLYGFTHLNSNKFQVSFIEGDDRQWNWFRRLWYPLEVQIAQRIKMGFTLHIAFDNLTRLREADIIISTTDACGLPIALFKILGLLKTPVIYISQGLSDKIEQLPEKSRVRQGFQTIYGKLLHSVEQVLVLGYGSIEPLVNIFHLSPQKIAAIPFGIDMQFWTPGSHPNTGDYILSVGSDLARDYDTLLKAIADKPLKIVTRLPIHNPYPDRPIEIGSEFSDLELRNLYQNARFVVIPLQDVTQPSGQSATLQAMACGKAVILTKTQGLWDSNEMIHQQNCYFVDPNNVENLQAGICYLWEHPDRGQYLGDNARITVEKYYNSRCFATQLTQYIQKNLHD